ncbi:hypothetical protein V6V47_29110 [Micromonospora sp. CPCC 205539]|uniref:hypothetical protein n=1 Tax=Micromonospora sp. CPCC 205539 TaxID=3122408 RepID=UPI002FF23D18
MVASVPAAAMAGTVEATIKLQVSASHVESGDLVTVTAAVTGITDRAPLPTGSVTFIVDSKDPGEQVGLSGGNATYAGGDSGPPVTVVVVP